jgi:hypothetical protein
MFAPRSAGVTNDRRTNAPRPLKQQELRRRSPAGGDRATG